MKEKSTKKPFIILSKLHYYLTVILLALTLVCGILISFSSIRDFITPYLGLSNKQSLGTAYLAWVGNVILIVIFWLGKKLDNIGSNVKNETNETIFEGGVIDIYGKIENEIICNQSKKSKILIDIIGYTLFSVAPKLNYWKNIGILKNISLNLYHIDINHITNSPLIKDTWKEKLKNNLQIIDLFIQDNEIYLEKNNIQINLIPYLHAPTVHGFKLGNGSMYVSFVSWENGKVADPDFDSKFEIVKSNDSSRRAVYLRKLFNNCLLNSPKVEKIDKVDDKIKMIEAYVRKITAILF